MTSNVGLSSLTTHAGLRAAGISKRYGHRQVLDSVDLVVCSGEIVALVGENGAGKSTLLQICAGLLRPDHGTVSVDGRLGYCPQAATFLEALRVEEHLILFGRARGLERREAIRRGCELLDELAFAGSIRQSARELSGGSRQKLNLALALLGDPAVMLLDEPYQGFDRGSYVSFWDQLHRWRATGAGVLVVTHLLAELELADRVVELRPPPP